MPIDGSPYRISGTDGAGLNVRAEPSVAAAILTALPEGMIVQALDRAWRSVRAPGGDEGWAANQFLRAEAGDRYRVVDTDRAGLNLRDGPSTAAGVLALLPQGTVVQTLDRAWRKIREPGGTVGWGAEQFLTPV